MELMDEFVQRCDWLSLRGTAYWSLNIAGCNKFGLLINKFKLFNKYFIFLGAEKLTQMGWECGENFKNKIQKKNLNLIRQFIIGYYSTKSTKKTFLRRSASDSQIFPMNLFNSYDKLENFNEESANNLSLSVEKDCLIFSEEEVNNFFII